MGAYRGVESCRTAYPCVTTKSLLHLPLGLSGPVEADDRRVVEAAAMACCCCQAWMQMRDFRPAGEE